MSTDLDSAAQATQPQCAVITEVMLIRASLYTSILYTSDLDPALTISSNAYTVHLSYIFSKHSPVCFSQVQDQIPIVMKFFGTERDYENKFLTDLTSRKQITFPIIDYNTPFIILY